MSYSSYYVDMYLVLKEGYGIQSLNVNSTATDVDGPPYVWYDLVTASVTEVRPGVGRLIPILIALDQNFPNPFNPSTQINFNLAKEEYVALKVYDMLGREIATLVNGKNEPGQHSVTWNATNVPSGVYYYRLVAGTFVQTKKMVVMK